MKIVKQLPQKLSTVLPRRALAVSVGGQGYFLGFCPLGLEIMRMIVENRSTGFVSGRKEGSRLQ